MKLFFKILLLLLFTLNFSCSSRKVKAEKKVQETSEITKKDVALEKDIQTHRESLELTKFEEFKVNPEDPAKPASYTINGKKVDLNNASITYKKSETSKSSEEKENDQSILKDNTETEKQEYHKEKVRETERASASWGLNIGIGLGILAAIILLYFHFQKKKYTGT